MPFRRCEFSRLAESPDDQAAVHIRARHGIPAAHGHGLRAVAHQLAAFENAAHEGMRLELLEGFVRIESRIVVFEAGDQSERDAVLAQAVDPAAAVHAGIERPAQRMRHPARADAARRNFPQLLDADAVDLRIEAVEIFLRDEVLGQRAARALGEHGDLGAQFVARREIVFGLAVFVAAFVFGDHAGDCRRPRRSARRRRIA